MTSHLSSPGQSSYLNLVFTTSLIFMLESAFDEEGAFC